MSFFTSLSSLFKGPPPKVEKLTWTPAETRRRIKDELEYKIRKLVPVLQVYVDNEIRKNSLANSNVPFKVVLKADDCPQLRDASSETLLGALHHFRINGWLVVEIGDGCYEFSEPTNENEASKFPYR